MLRVDVFESFREPVTEETRDFTDVLQKGKVFSLTLCNGGNDYAHLAVDVQRDLVKKYITGGQGIPPVEFPRVGKKPVKVSESLFQTVANVYVLQPGEKDEDKYSPEELVAFAISWKNAWPQVIKWAEDITGDDTDDGEAQEKNVSGVASSSS